MALAAVSPVTRESPTSLLILLPMWSPPLPPSSDQPGERACPAGDWRAAAGSEVMAVAAAGAVLSSMSGKNPGATAVNELLSRCHCYPTL